MTDMSVALIKIDDELMEDSKVKLALQLRDWMMAKCRFRDQKMKNDFSNHC